MVGRRGRPGEEALEAEESRWGAQAALWARRGSTVASIKVKLVAARPRAQSVLPSRPSRQRGRADQQRILDAVLVLEI